MEHVSVAPEPEKQIPNEAPPAPPPEQPMFFRLWIDKTGGLNFEIDMSNAPDTMSALLRMLGNVGLALYQLHEWATALIRNSMMARALEEQRLKDMLAKLKEEGATVN